MKTLVISGAHSNVGKTGLAENLCSLLRYAVHVKIGHGIEKKGHGNIFYRNGTSYEDIISENSDARFLIIESNSILCEITPDCAIYLSGGLPKPGAAQAERKADIIRGKTVRRETVDTLAGRLGIDRKTVTEMIRLAGAFVDTEEQE